MGALFGYYSAADDQDAARAVVRADGKASGTGYDQLVVKGIDPIVDLLVVEFCLTGRPGNAIKSDPRHGHPVARVGDGDVVCVSLTEGFRDALASVDPEYLDNVARGWASSPRFSTPPEPDHLADFLGQLAALAKRAVGQGHGLYCWMCP